jgi:2-haloalkanoic acid dehalogenase type II
MIKAIFLDCYGTLISTGNGSVEAAKEILDKNNFSFNAELFYKHWKNIHKENISKLKRFKKEEEIFIDDLKMLYKFYGIKSDERDDVKYMLNSLYKRSFFDDSLHNLIKLKEKYEIYIASNTDREPLIKNLGEDINLFTGIFTSEDLMVYKPEKYFFKKILKTTGYNKEEIIFVGDSLIDDISGSKNMGIYSVLIDRDKQYKESEIKPNFIINGLSELINVVNEINEKRGHFA